ncbi:putative RNA polymerase II subunit B1 CTD phosphatase rpap2 [Merluccius polli]|uniref:RNA polymerase II subunit B1 CTD phosphatase RPAP2 homolog n=1 Tax=Merluccius polli TaxID=89951 RepID=A0AA47MC81_MERPO|nr:putative RNA polymerase II subunit B1 CTD phosphatase rpap2 [Merluccius polli]
MGVYLKTAGKESMAMWWTNSRWARLASASLGYRTSSSRKPTARRVLSTEWHTRLGRVSPMAVRLLFEGVKIVEKGTKISTANSLRGDTASGSESWNWTSRRGSHRLFIQLHPPPPSPSLSRAGWFWPGLASSTKGRTKAMRLVQQWHSGWKSSASCSRLRGQGSLETCSSRDTEDLGAVSLLDAGPPRRREHIVVLWAVLVILHPLLCVAKGRGGSKAVNAKSAEEEARRREVMKEALREKLELESRAVQVVERLLEDRVPEDFLIDCARFITPANYKDVIEERFIAKLCGYPICPNKLGKVPTQQFKISTKMNKVYDITERKCFCSNFCYKASKEYELRISTTPLWLRHHESPPKITLMKKGDGGSSGQEVRIAVRRLQEEDIENPAVAVGPSSEPLPAPASPHSDDSGGDDDEQEPGFVSSVITAERPGPRVHWGELPTARTDHRGPSERQKKESRRRNGEGENLVKERGENGDESVVCKREKEADIGGTSNIDEPNTHPPRVQQTPVEEEEEEKSSVDAQAVEVEEAVALLNSCRIAEQVTDTAPVHITHTGTEPLRGNDTPAAADSNKTESEPRTEARPAWAASSTTQPCPTPGLDVTQVGMSKRGAAGLRKLLLHHHQPAGVRPRSVRENLLESLRRTLNEWRSDETRVFLYGPDHAPLLSGPQEEKDKGLGKEEEEEELDEDDFEEQQEEEMVVVGRGRPSAPAPDYDTLRRQTREQELRVQEFYQGSRVTEQPAGDTQATAQGQETKDPILPLVDSQAQVLIQKRITVDKLTRSLRNIVGPLGLTMTDVSMDLNNLVRTFRFTNTNIIHKTPQWTLIAVVLLHLAESCPHIGDSKLACFEPGTASMRRLHTPIQWPLAKEQAVQLLSGLLCDPAPLVEPARVAPAPGFASAACRSLGPLSFSSCGPERRGRGRGRTGTLASRRSATRSEFSQASQKVLADGAGPDAGGLVVVKEELAKAGRALLLMPTWVTSRPASGKAVW